MLFELNEIQVPQYTNIIQIFQLQKYLRLRKRIQYLEYLHPKFEFKKKLCHCQIWKFVFCHNLIGKKLCQIFQKLTSESCFCLRIISLNFGNPLLDAAALVPDAAEMP